MRFSISNLGAIKEGQVDLSQKFIVFCGPNGTGKTYLSYVIFSFFKRKLHITGDEKFAEKLINEKRAFLEIDFEKLFLYRTNMLKTVESNVDELFGIGESERIKLFKDFHVESDITNDSFKSFIINNALAGRNKLQGINIGINKEAGSSQVEIVVLDEVIQNDSIKGFSFFLDSYIYNFLATYPVGNVEMFTVERNSIYTFSKELSVRKQEALDNVLLLMDKDKKIDRFDLYFRNNYKYPLPIRLGLETADNLVEIKKRDSQFVQYSSFLENELLHGRVQVSNEGEIQFKPAKCSRTTLPIQMSASIVKTLSSLDLYLRHMATPNDLIIIDEPEINLHPDNQILVARMLARLANNGFRVLLSTHSDYIIREINNLVMMSRKEAKVVKGLLAKETYLDDEYINPNDLGVYFFNYASPKSRQVKVQRLKVGLSGFSVNSIDSTIESQNKIAEELYYGIKYGNNE